MTQRIPLQDLTTEAAVEHHTPPPKTPSQATDAYAGTKRLASSIRSGAKTPNIAFGY